MLSKEEGGRHTPFFKGYRPQFYFRTTDVTGVAELPEGMEMVMPGDNVELDGGADYAGGVGKGIEVCNPRRRPHGGRRHGFGDYQVSRKIVDQGTGLKQYRSLSKSALIADLEKFRCAGGGESAACGEDGKSW